MASNSPLCFFVNRKVISAGKHFLSTLEDLVVSNEENKELLVSTISKFSIPEEDKDLLVSILGQGNPLSQAIVKQLRKRTLDHVNEAAREINMEFDNYKIEIKA
jgi:phosphoribosylaminoimidazole-succinocarboxamide synthase